MWAVHSRLRQLVWTKSTKLRQQRKQHSHNHWIKRALRKYRLCTLPSMCPLLPNKRNNAQVNIKENFRISILDPDHLPKEDDTVNTCRINKFALCRQINSGQKPQCFSRPFLIFLFFYIIVSSARAMPPTSSASKISKTVISSAFFPPNSLIRAPMVATQGM